MLVVQRGFRGVSLMMRVPLCEETKVQPALRRRLGAGILGAASPMGKATSAASMTAATTRKLSYPDPAGSSVEMGRPDPEAA